jgi:spore coat protein U-like protein
MRLIMKNTAGALLVVAGIGLGWTGSAQSAEANICRLDVTPVHFGKYNPFATGIARGNGTITYNCTAASPISIGLQRSSGASPMTRRMALGAGGLEYNLYLDAACTIVWGDGTGGSQMYRDPAPSPNSNIAVPIYGCIPAGQRRAAMGAYGENFIVMINF